MHLGAFMLRRIAREFRDWRCAPTPLRNTPNPVISISQTSPLLDWIGLNPQQFRQGFIRYHRNQCSIDDDVA